MTFSLRRMLALSGLLVVSVLTLFVYQAYSVTLYRSQYLSGWVLFAVIVFLAVYNVRKKLPFLPLGSSATWLQLHIYAGWFTVFLFLLHLDYRIPTGFLEGTLAAAYLIVAASGALGLWISRGYPSRISRHERAYVASSEKENRKFGEELIFERIPVYVRQVREIAEEAVVRSGEESKSTSIADFYADRLHGYFARPRNFWFHILESSRPLNTLLGEVIVLQRYLSEKERVILDELVELIRIKNQIDYQYALQAMLKRWLFVHVPLTYCLLILSLLHVIVVYAFSGGNR